VASIRQLSASQSELHDLRAEASVQVGMAFGVLGLITGSLWARFTWGAWWVDDPQLNGAMVTVLVYAGYLILRSTVENKRLKARLSAVYNLFAFVILIILLMVLPRFTESLHPGKGGNPGFNSYDLDSSLRMVFYPAVIGWMLLGIWMYRVRLATAALNQKLQQL
jgi:heme exporter protein C